jgi:hypothetical protein
LLDEELWLRFSLAGRKRVVEHFNVDLQTRRLEDVFADIAASQSGLAENDCVSLRMGRTQDAT